jgi:Flp pilus assembly protein TadB
MLQHFFFEKKFKAFFFYQWLCIFFIMWRISAYVSSRVIISAFIISAFIVPRLYISNKDIIDARIQQGQTIIHTQLHNAQEFANTKISNVKSQMDSKKPSTTTKAD